MTGDQLKEKRIALGMTQAEFAHALGMTLRTIQRYEHGNYGVPRVVKLAIGTLSPRA